MLALWFPAVAVGALCILETLARRLIRGGL